MTDTSFGARLRTLRKKSGMTQEQLAEAIGVHLNTISRWENNLDAPNMVKLHLIALALNISENELINPAEPQKWVLQIKLADNKKEEFTDMTKDMPCVAAITGNPYGADLHLSGNWDTFADDDKFMDFIEQVMNSREAILQLRNSMSKVWKSNPS